MRSVIALAMLTGCRDSKPAPQPQPPSQVHEAFPDLAGPTPYPHANWRAGLFVDKTNLASFSSPGWSGAFQSVCPKCGPTYVEVYAKFAMSNVPSGTRIIATDRMTGERRVGDGCLEDWMPPDAAPGTLNASCTLRAAAFSWSGGPEHIFDVQLITQSSEQLSVTLSAMVGYPGE